jgi:hypothetical protein
MKEVRRRTRIFRTDLLPVAIRRFARSRLAAASLLVAALLLGGAAQAQAQFSDAGNRVRQSVGEQLAAASVGDSVEVMLNRNRDVRPTGVIVAQDSTFLRLRKPGGSRQTIRRRLIYAVTRVDAEAQARLEAERSAVTNIADPNRTRLLIGPTGRTLSGGEVYLTGHEIVFPYVSLGVGRPLDLRAGISALPNTVQFMYGGAKFGLIQTEGFNLAVGAVATATTNVITTEEGADEYGGVVYGVSTFGSPRGALSLGGGYLAAGGAIEEQAFALLGGELRLSNSRVKLLTENYVLFGSSEDDGAKSTQLFGGEPFAGDVSGIASLAVRLIGKRASADLGVATSNRWWNTTLPVLPIVSVSYSIGGP